MSGSGAKKEKDSSSGSGFLSGLLLAGGAAAMGFLAKSMYDDYKEFQAEEQLMKERRFHPSNSGSSSGSQSPTSNGGMAQVKNKEEDGTEKKGEDVSEATRCVVCMDNVRQVIIEPCGHVCLCKNCAQEIVKTSKTKPRCPVCHATISDIKSCYLP